MLVASLAFDEPGFRSLLDKLCDRWSENIEPGLLFAVDESILGSNSEYAHKEGMLKYMKGKPHPKGYFFVGGLQCFTYTQLSYIIDLEWKWSHSSPNMYDALMLVVGRAERKLSQQLVVLADSGYPSSKLLNRPGNVIKSTFIASASVSNVSGDLRTIPVLIGPTAKSGVSYVFHHPKRRLIAYIGKKTRIHSMPHHRCHILR